MSINPVNSNPLLSNMQSLASQAKGLEVSPGKLQSEFGDLLKMALEKVNENQMKSGELQKAYELGDPNVSLAQVMIESEKAGIGFQATLHVRNKLVQAYKDIMSMPI